jgi:hypothetical protein
MDTQITLLSDDALDAVAGGEQNNGVGNIFAHGVGALPRTGGGGKELENGLLGFLALCVTGVLVVGL